MEITIDKLNTLSVEPNLIPRDAFTEAYKYLSGVHAIGAHAIRSWSWDNPDSEWNLFSLTAKKAPYKGKWTKRFASYMYKTYKEKIPDDIMSKVGEILSRYTERNERNYHFEFAKFSDWAQGAFKERDGKSCWWGDGKDYSRKGIVQDPRGYAILFYESKRHFDAYSKKKGAGRCWAIDQGEYVVIFNAYGIPLSDIAAILSQKWKCSFAKAQVKSHGTHINSGNLNNINPVSGVQPYGPVGLCYVIGSSDALKALPDVIDIGDIRFKDQRCAICGNLHIKPEMLSLKNKEYSCQECVKTLIECRYCGKHSKPEQFKAVYDPRDDKRYLVCIGCEGVETGICTLHGAVVHPVTKVWHTNKHYCVGCMAHSKAITCDGACGHVVDRYIQFGTRKQIVKMCIPCHKKLVKLEVIG